MLSALEARLARGALMRAMPQGSVGAEIGVWKAEFSRVLVRSVKPAKLHLVDPWVFVSKPEYSSAIYGGSIAKGQADMDQIYTDVLAAMAEPIARGQVEVHRMTSAEAAGKFADNSLDWVYIDGDHSYQAVQEDLRLWSTKVKSGGLISGDDYGLKGWWDDGVTRAADEFSSASGYPLTVHRHQFLIRK